MSRSSSAKAMRIMNSSSSSKIECMRGADSGGQGMGKTTPNGRREQHHELRCGGERLASVTLRWMEPVELVAGRSCDSCTLCCKVIGVAVADYQKPRGHDCE